MSRRAWRIRVVPLLVTSGLWFGSELPVHAAEVAPSTTKYDQSPPAGVTTLPARRMADFLAQWPQFSTFNRAVQIAGLTNELNKATQLTVFVPDDSAFGRVPKAKLAELLADKSALRKLLRHHMVDGVFDALTLIQNSPTLKDLDGHDLKVLKRRGIPFTRIDGSVLIGSNYHATNGLVHVLNDVIWPGVVVPVDPKPVARPASTTLPDSAPTTRPSTKGIIGVPTTTVGKG